MNVPRQAGSPSRMPVWPQGQCGSGSRRARKLDGRLERFVDTVKPRGRCADLPSPGSNFEEARAEKTIIDLGHARNPPATRSLDRFAVLDVDGSGRRSGDGKELLNVTHGAPFSSHEFPRTDWRNDGHSMVRVWHTCRFRALKTIRRPRRAPPEASFRPSSRSPCPRRREDSSCCFSCAFFWRLSFEKR